MALFSVTSYAIEKPTGQIVRAAKIFSAMHKHKTLANFFISGG